MEPLLSACAAVYVALCPLPKAAPCQHPSAIWGEVWGDRELGPATLRWKLNGKILATDSLRQITPSPQAVALVLGASFGDRSLTLEVVTGQETSQDWLSLPPFCGSWLQLTAFSWGPKGVSVRLINAGPFSTDPIPVRWLVNGLPLSESTVGPLGAGQGVELALPAAGHRLLERVLGEPRPASTKGQVLTPVIITLMARPGFGDLESSQRVWSFHLGFVELAGKAGRTR